MKRRPFSRILLGLLLLSALPVFAEIEGSGIEPAAKRLEGLLMAPCCGGTTLAMHDSGPAVRMKEEIRTLLRSGLDEQAILDTFVERHGTTILAMPPARGFDLAAYLLPVFMLVGGAVALGVAMLRWRRRAPTESTPDDPSPSVSEEWRDRLRRELERYG